MSRQLDGSAQPCAVLDLDRRLIRVNRAFEELVGYSAEDLSSMVPADITPEKWHASGKEALDRLRATGEAVRYEKEYRRKDGRVVAVDVTVDLDRDDRGEPRGYIAFITDISERKAVEQRLRESEERFRRLYDEAPFGYHEIDRDGTIVAVNLTECDMLGYTRDEMLGRPIFDYVAPEQRAQAQNAVREKVEGKRALAPIERPYETRDGRRIIVAIEERYRLDESGRVAGIRKEKPGPLRRHRGHGPRPRVRGPDPRRQPRGLPAARLLARGTSPSHDA
jgi:PAS domain S-box-containing protein